ncbi:MAG: hypothetical protein NVS1B4_03090 [Gemmatimonadaceae bacterium]
MAFALCAAATDPPGPGIDPDALAYIGAAQSFAHGDGLRVPVANWTSADTTAPLAHFPPGQSFAVAIPIRFGMDPVQSARLIVAFSAAMSIAIVAALVASVVGMVPAVAVAVALVASPVTAGVHLSAMSEPLFLALLIATLAAMVRTPDRPLVYGVFAALALMVRYAGVSLCGAAGIWALTRSGPWSTRWRRASLAVAPGVLMQTAWVIRTTRVAGPASIRRLSVYDAHLPAALHRGAETVAAWVVPWESAGVWHDRLAAGVVLVLVAVVAAGTRRAIAAVCGRSPTERLLEEDRTRGPRLLAATALCGACYIAALILSKVVADPNIPFDERILAPLLALVTIATITAATMWLRDASRVIRGLAVVAFGAWLVASAIVTRDAAAYGLDVGIDFASERWRKSDVLTWVRREGSAYSLFTNWPIAVYLYTGRVSRLLPAASDSAVARDFKQALIRRHGLLVVFDDPSPDALHPDSLAVRGGLRLLKDGADGRVYGP